jgi:DNA replication licensing factor MCM3
MLVRFKHSDNSNYGSQDGSIRVRQFPQTDDKQRRLVTEFGRCVFRDHQTLVLQEMPERSPPGLLPRSVEVMLDNDLVDKCKPGDRIQVVGMYHALAAGAASTAGRGTFRTVRATQSLSSY